ncbi:dixin-like isoform X4 [Channa argus]|uniref:dixin-like isoform X4 n=1 Tax=Channa argus TaxID=215402 RepID=UPI003521D06C
MIASLSRGSLLDEVLHGGFKEQQVAAYVSWVNSQLKKKTGLKPVTDLRRDLQDGVVLTQLIEIVAGEGLEEVYETPQSKEESRKNVEQVLQFMSSRHIRMSHISARDIVDGNLKSVMRIILALAAHFKPSANHRSATGSGRSLTGNSISHNSVSTVAIAQGAAAALASSHLDASHPANGTRIHSGQGLDVEKSVCVRALVEQYERGAPDEHDSASPGSLSFIIPLSSPRTPPISSSDRQQEDLQREESSGESSHVAGDTAWEASLSVVLEKEVQETRKMVTDLQALLLHGLTPEDEQNGPLTLEQGNAKQQLVVIRSCLDQSMEEAQELKRELLRCKQEIRNLQGFKDAQQQRLCTQEASILQLKQELLRASMTKDDLSNQNAELQWKLDECNRLWGECKNEIGQKDRLLQQFKHQLEDSHKQKTPTATENNGYSSSGNPALSVSGERGKFPRHKGQHPDSDSGPCTKVSHSNNGPSASTKILYFAGKSPTPSMISIPKRLGEVTLKDVKAAVDREGNYRYHFKALDPEFGTVKEEVFLDGAIVPGWEGKIVAWLEEDRGEERPL